MPLELILIGTGVVSGVSLMSNVVMYTRMRRMDLHIVALQGEVRGLRARLGNVEPDPPPAPPPSTARDSQSRLRLVRS